MNVHDQIAEVGGEAEAMTSRIALNYKASFVGAAIKRTEGSMNRTQAVHHDA